MAITYHWSEHRTFSLAGETEVGLLTTPPVWPVSCRNATVLSQRDSVSEANKGC